MSIVLTQKAADQLMKAMSEQGLVPERTYLRVTYHPRAHHQQRCSIELEEDLGRNSESDEVLESSGVQVRCDRKSYHYVKGITLDYLNASGAQGFTITRPPSKWPAEEPFAQPWIREALRTVMDPEIGLNIVDLGLIYETRLEASTVTVIMTMTTPACPMTEMIVSDVKSGLRQASREISAVNVEVVWEPPWTSEMISDPGRDQMGWR